MDKKDFYKKLIQRYVTNQATEEELEAFFSLMESAEMDDELQAFLTEEAAKEDDKAQIPHKRHLWPRITAAASIVFILLFGGYFLLHQQSTYQISQNSKKQDIAPGHNQATLTLAGGRKIILTRSLHGQIAVQGKTTIQVSSGGAIAYNAANTSDNAIAYNTLSTTRGQTSPVPLILSDGTKVWLNAMSSITFPTAFNGKDRTVKITGEVYFEVAHNDAMPFRVSVKGQTIEDIGTHFNVNAYDDEIFMKTTLIEGSIRIAQNGQQVVLKPGQQAILKPGNGKIAINAADAEETIAWLSGQFRFKDENMQTIMRELSRWYDMDVLYQGDITTDGFNGKISRYKNLSQTLQMLESTKLVHFKIEGRRVTVMK